MVINSSKARERVSSSLLQFISMNLSIYLVTLYQLQLLCFLLVCNFICFHIPGPRWSEKVVISMEGIFSQANCFLLCCDKFHAVSANDVVHKQQFASRLVIIGGLKGSSSVLTLLFVWNKFHAQDQLTGPTTWKRIRRIDIRLQCYGK